MSAAAARTLRLAEFAEARIDPRPLLDDDPGLVRLRRRLRLVRPTTPDELHGYCRGVLGFDLPRRARGGPGHTAPFDYLMHAYFENGPGPRDCIVWAARGGGKTRIGSLATLLDLLFKPGIQVRILGGSLEQSSKMYAYLREMLESEVFRDLVAGRVTGRRIALRNGSAVEVLAQSEASVRGQRVQRLRCDEVDLFTPEIWRAAQFVTRTARCGDVLVRGGIEALSTMHQPHGLMQRLVDDSGRIDARQVFRWGVLDVLERCPRRRDCATCPLWEDCGGRARHGWGFVAIDDAIQQKSRASAEAWASEMRCERPSRSDAVYPEFDEGRHVVADPDLGRRIRQRNGNREPHLRLVAGMDFGFRSPTVVVWAIHDAIADRLHVIDEHVAAGLALEEHLRIMAARDWPRPSWIGIDPAGRQRHEHSGVSSEALLRRAGHRVRSRSASLRGGLDAVRRRLRTADGRSRLTIDPGCVALRRALAAYHFPSERPEAREPVKDGPDHACDALRYLVVALDLFGPAEAAVRRYA